MEDQRSIFATQDQPEVLDHKARLEALGIPCQVVISDSPATESVYDARVGVDTFYRFNLLVPAQDESRALDLLGVPGDEAELPPETESAQPAPPAYGGDFLGLLGIILLNVMVAHLPRALLLSFRLRSRAMRIGGVVLSLGMFLTYGLTLSLLVSPTQAFTPGGLLTGLVLFALWGAAVGAVDALITRNRFVFGFVLADVGILALAALVLFLRSWSLA